MAHGFYSWRIRVIGRSWYVPTFVMMVCPISALSVPRLTLYNADILAAMYYIDYRSNSLSFEYKYRVTSHSRCHLTSMAT
jgi:hypothetical protein